MSHSSVAIEDIAGLSERTLFERTIASQAYARSPSTASL